jgi:hypothetical protein
MFSRRELLRRAVVAPSLTPLVPLKAPRDVRALLEAAYDDWARGRGDLATLSARALRVLRPEWGRVCRLDDVDVVAGVGPADLVASRSLRREYGADVSASIVESPTYEFDVGAATLPAWLVGHGVFRTDYHAEYSGRQACAFSLPLFLSLHTLVRAAADRLPGDGDVLVCVGDVDIRLATAGTIFAFSTLVGVCRRRLR